MSGVGQFVTEQVLPALLAVEHELLLFASFWFIVGAVDEAAFDLGYLWLRLTGRLRERTGRADGAPFAAECLTEDYELGLLVSRSGGSSRFLRVRDHLGELVATRAYFPGRLDDAVRQKARWIHGIALQGWDRLGWFGGHLMCGWRCATGAAC